MEPQVEDEVARERMRAALLSEWEERVRAGLAPVPTLDQIKLAIQLGKQLSSMVSHG